MKPLVQLLAAALLAHIVLPAVAQDNKYANSLRDKYWRNFEFDGEESRLAIMGFAVIGAVVGCETRKAIPLINVFLDAAENLDKGTKGAMKLRGKAITRNGETRIYVWTAAAGDQSSDASGYCATINQWGELKSSYRFTRINFYAVCSLNKRLLVDVD